MRKNTKKKIIVILGQTATGKSDVAVLLAKKISTLGRPDSCWNGVEIISADSRQVYKKLNIGTGKITKKEMRGIPHHLLNVANPKNQFSAFDYVKQAHSAIDEIYERGKIPIICGGTGFYIEALLGNISLSQVPPNEKLRQKLEKLSIEELLEMLQKKNPERAQTIEQKNKRRLIRALEVELQKQKTTPQKKSPYEVFKIGLTLPSPMLKKKIEERLQKRLKQGMVSEARKLHDQGLSWKRMEELGLEYRFLAQYLQKKISKEEMVERLGNAIWHYAKRQNTWFKRDKKIIWFKPNELNKMEKSIKKFLI